MSYPIHHKHTSTSTTQGAPANISVYTFTDKILITITRDGRLAQWLSVPLEASSSPTGFSHPDFSHPDFSHPDFSHPDFSHPDFSHPGLALPSTSGFTTEHAEHDLLPDPQLTPCTLLGASTPEREALGQLFAVQIASALRLRDPGESRTVLLGLGLDLGLHLGGDGGEDGGESEDRDREVFFEVLEAVVRCL